MRTSRWPPCWAATRWATAGLSLHHALCQTIVRTAGTPHALTNAVMLPHTLRFMAGAFPTQLAARRGARGGSAPAAGRWRRSQPARARPPSETSTTPARMPAIVENALAHPGIAAMDPPVPRQDELRGVLEMALDG